MVCASMEDSYLPGLCLLPLGFLLVTVVAGGTGRNCAFSCGGMLPSAPSVSGKWKSERFSLAPADTNTVEHVLSFG